MKEKIQLLSKFAIEYENPDIHVSERTLILDVECGKKHAGYIELTSSNDVAIRAMIFSSNKWMKCLRQSVVGESGRIQYEFDARTLEVGEVVEGCFYVVSNGGEITIPYCVYVKAPSLYTSMGLIEDLDQFAMLARENMAEALRIFNSEEFARIFLGNKKSQMVYSALRGSRNQALAMEEFLCALKRKQPVKIAVSQDVIEYENLRKPVSERLLIEKNTWGHVRVSISTEGDAVTVYKKTITEDDFLGSYYQLEYEINPRKSAQGAIILETFDQIIRIPVFIKQDRLRNEDIIKPRILKRSWLEINRKYMDKQLGRISNEEWITKTRDAIDGCLNCSRDGFYRILEAQFLIMTGDVPKARRILDSVNGMELRYSSALKYCYYLYVNAMAKADEHYTSYAKDTIRFYAQGQCQDRWEVHYMMMKLSQKDGRQPASNMRTIKRLYEQRLMGAPMYLEAVNMINMDPSIIVEMDDFTVSLFMWGVRHDCLRRDSVIRFADLAMRMRKPHAQCMHMLMELCEIHETKEILAAVLHMLILGDYREKRFHKWYELGIRSSIKIHEIYEYYMATLDIDSCRHLPLAVLIYFQYDNHLDREQKAFLYSYVVENRIKYEKLFEGYDAIIKAFTFEQLRAGRIDEHLAVLYEHYLGDERLTTSVLRQVADVMFKQEVRCKHSGMVSVVVDYAELVDEMTYPVVDNVAYVDIFMDDYRLIFIDENGGRHVSSVEYDLIRLMDASKYIRDCYEQCGDHELLVLNRSERALKYHMMDESAVRTYKMALRLDSVNDHYRKTILNNLIDYYYDNYEGETLEKYLLQIDIHLLGAKERSHIIEYFIQRGLFERAYEAIKTYGSHGINDKRIMRLCSRIIREKEYQKDELLVDLAYQAFDGHRYDEAILEYLIRYYMGTAASLYAIWKAAGEYEVDADQLEERLLCVMLFTESMIEQGCDVLASYYNRHAGDRIIRAYLTYYAYHYLRDELKGNVRIFGLMEIEADQMEQAKDILKLALLKREAQLSESLPEYFGRLREEVAYFMNKGVVLPFFKHFMGSCEVPEELTDSVYAVYATKASRLVEIHYLLPDEKDGEYKHEHMSQVVPGIYVKQFRVYGDERLRYYITELTPDGEKISQTEIIEAERKTDQHLEAGVDQINRMIDYVEFHDDLGLDRAMEEYWRWDKLTDAMFEIK